MNKAEKGKNISLWYTLSAFFIFGYFLLFFSSCSEYSHQEEADKLNEISYAYHYRNIDSTKVYAERAFLVSRDYDAGRAEALNNLVFVSIVKMEYDNAYKLLDSISKITDNQIELLIADINYLRLCQRESRNKEFYDYHVKAERRIKRINEEKETLNEHSKRRMIYAQTEFNIVVATYYYYVGLLQQSQKSLNKIVPNGEICTDTAQLLAYYYNIGSGNILKSGSIDEIYQKEFDYLMSCYTIANRHGYVFWEANALQSLSEHLQIKKHRDKLVANNMPSIKYINTDNMPDSLLAGNLAQRSLELFERYGDVYQTAGAYRTLAECYWFINDYPSAVICLERALNTNKAINQAPDLIASIREQLSVVYSAMNDKSNSDYNRNIYLDIQEQTRQDRALEARAEQLEKSSKFLNGMILAIVVMMLVVLASLYVFDKLRKKCYDDNYIRGLLNPLNEWQEQNTLEIKGLEERYEEANEEYLLKRADVVNNKKRNLEQRAKISLVNSITPFIERILNEIRALYKKGINTEQQETRYEYIRELTDKINDYNAVLTEWIQLKQGELRLQIETFRLKELFEIVRKSNMSFRIKGIELIVEDTEELVKADKILTLFMINTLSDNARKFTDRNGVVRIEASSTDEYVEISVSDTGRGMDEDQISHLFDRNPIKNDIENAKTVKSTKSHGFGLINCMGIINKYRKTGRLFSSCMLGVESSLGKGSRFFFRLPKGIAKIILCLCFFSATNYVNAENQAIDKATIYADSAFFSNINGEYAKTLTFADSCRKYLNQHYLEQHPDKPHILMKREGNVTEKPSEIRWFQNDVKTNYDIILSIRNESAVAALALHQWSLYRYCNSVYTQLFKEVTADKTLGEYCRIMQKSETNKNISIVILLLLFLMIFPAYYFLYYRHHIYYQFCIEQIKRINDILLGDETPNDKFRKILKIDTKKFPDNLKDIVRKIETALKKSVSVYQKEETRIELIKDECRRAVYENDKLYVNNNILDNCLSTLKHETMYYPSRIRQLIDNPNKEIISSIDELATYYKELYYILSIQATRQAETLKVLCMPVKLSDIRTDIDSEITVLGDSDMLIYIFEILQKQNDKRRPTVVISPKDNRYVDIRVYMTAFVLDERQCSELFYPKMDNIPYLLCRQIVRDIGESCNMRGCGIVAQPGENRTEIVITLAIYSNYHKNKRHE